MADQRDALALGVRGDARKVEIGIGLGEAEVVAIGEPVPVPADIPAFDQHSGYFVIGGEIDQLERIGGGRAMLGARRPALRFEMHSPPDADIFARFHPTDVAQRIGVIEIEHQVARGVERRRIGRDGQHSPRGGKGTSAADLRAARRGCEHRLQLRADRPGDIHSGIINQRRFVDRDMGAIGEDHRQRSLAGADAADRGRFVKILLTVAFERRGPPGTAVAGNRELGQFLGDVPRPAACAVGEAIAKGDPVVISADFDRQSALEAAFFGQIDRYFTIVIADRAIFTPRRGPGLVLVAAAFGNDLKIAQHLRLVGEQKAQLAVGDHRLAEPIDAIVRPPLPVQAERDGQHLARRSQEHIGRGRRGSEQQGKQ